ncbi:hypothetical protein QQS21_008738 [Conoideocrella luteorostrata]|uniref:Biotin-protein ligase N-terminal domain-containing protein n=1 Tax=Conoideocrella luteorostrata TaxID=1105319 RepID=A0AAJ0FWA2_9HYPO|nr:hypothetical protein QQS21_008738 [Conoideocrella luteorostrata]
MYPSLLFTVSSLALTALTAVADTNSSRPLALVYRGDSACKGCSEAVAKLLEGSPQNFAVTYVGPKEDTQISAETLSKAAAYAQPGGPDQTQAFRELEGHGPELRDFINNGGRYFGFCLGAYLAGPNEGFGFLPPGVNAVNERKSENAQVTSTDNAVIQINWNFRSKTNRFSAQATDTQWLFFQDGAAIEGLSDNSTVLGRYAQNGDVAASLTPLGKGWVALVGPHPEATSGWFQSVDQPGGSKENGVTFDIGYDFVNTAMSAGPVPDGRNTTNTNGGTGTTGRTGRTGKAGRPGRNGRRPGSSSPEDKDESRWGNDDDNEDEE